MTEEDRREIIVKGLFLGLMLFLSTLITLLINQDMPHIKVVEIFLIPIIIFYCLIGMFIRWLVYRSTLRKKGSNLFTGPSIVYWIWMVGAIFTAGAYFIPQVIRYTVLANLATLILLWLVDCLYLKKITKELNSDLEYYDRTIVEDLSRKPQNEDMFMEEINNYCNKNHLSLEIIEYGIPAKVKMNNVQYMVKLGQYYSLIGSIVYTLEFKNMVTKI